MISDDQPIQRVRKKKKKAKKNASAAPSLAQMAIIGAVILLAVFGLSCYSKTGFYWMIGGAILTYVLGAISVRHAADQESPFQGLMCTQIPFYQFYFELANFEVPQIRFAFYCQATAFCMAIAALCGNEVREWSQTRGVRSQFMGVPRFSGGANFSSIPEGSQKLAGG